MRIILPIDDPDRLRPFDPGEGIKSPLEPWQVQIKGLEAQRLYFADVLFAPKVNLATGELQPENFSNPGSLGVPDSYLAVASFPFSLSSASAEASLSADITLSAAPGGGQYVFLSASGTGAAEVLTMPSVRLDYATGDASIDNDGDLSYEDEAGLLDSDRDCISDARSLQEQDSFSYLSQPDGLKTTGELTGTLTAFTEAAGELFVNASPYRFSELTRFQKQLVNSASPPVDFDPSTLTQDDIVRIEYYTLSASGLNPPSRSWITLVELQEDPGMSLTAYGPSGEFDVRPESFADGGSADGFSLHYEAKPNNVLEAQVVAENAVGLRAFYFELNYDPARFDLSGYGSGGVLEPAAPGNVLIAELENIASASQPGLRALRYGETLPRPQESEGVGSLAAPLDGVVARFFFTRETPESDPLLSAVPPTDPNYAPELVWNQNTLSFSWYYNNKADFDQNGVVEPADLRPIARKFNHTPDFPPVFPDNSYDDMLDAVRDGRIDADDAGQIGAHQLIQVDKYILYSSSDPGSDYPLDGLGPNGPGAVTIATKDILSFEPGAGDFHYFYKVILQPAQAVPQTYFWVRPALADGTLGIASPPVQIP